MGDEQIIKGAASLGAGIATANPVGIVLGVAGLLSSLGQQRRAKKAEERAEQEAAESREAYLSYAERFDSPVQEGTTRGIAKSLELNPELMLGNNSFTNRPSFTEFPFMNRATNANVAQNTLVTPNETPQISGIDLTQQNQLLASAIAGNATGNQTQITESGITLPSNLPKLDFSLLENIDPIQVQQKLDQLSIIGTGKLEVPRWELMAGFDSLAKKTGYKSTNPDSEYYDPDVEFTGEQITRDAIANKQTDEDGNIILPEIKVSEDFKEFVAQPEFKERVEQTMQELQKPFTDENGVVDNQAFVESMNEKGQALINAGVLNGDSGSGAIQIDPTTGEFLFSGSRKFAQNMAQLTQTPLGGQLYANSEIQNPYGRFQDLSAIAQDRSDLFTGANDRRNLLADRSGMIEDTTGFLNDLRRGAQDFSGLATDTSTLASNTFANLQIATQAADIQAQQTDQALANTLSTIRATGAGAGGATAIAQAALQSKQSISATIEQQEARNTQLRAQGQQQIEQIRMNESRRLQDIALSERLRLEGLREREGLRLDAAAQTEAQRLQQIRFGEARRLDDVGFQEAGRIQQAQLSEAIRQQNIQLAEQQALRDADVAGVQYQQGLAFDIAQRNLDRLSGLATQSMVNQQQARASKAATEGAVAGGLFQLAGSILGGGS